MHPALGEFVCTMWLMQFLLVYRSESCNLNEHFVCIYLAGVGPTPLVAFSYFFHNATLLASPHESDFFYLFFFTNDPPNPSVENGLLPLKIQCQCWTSEMCFSFLFFFFCDLSGCEDLVKVMILEVPGFHRHRRLKQCHSCGDICVVYLSYVLYYCKGAHCDYCNLSSITELSFLPDTGSWDWKIAKKLSSGIELLFS